MELVVVMGIATLALGGAAPLTSNTLDAGSVREAAGFFGGRMRLARQQALARSANAGLVFDLVNGRWTFRVCVDGNGNGLRRADITRGTDPCLEGPFDVGVLFGGVRVESDASIRGPDGDAGSTDAVRFGSSDMASFSASGTCTAGSLYLRSPKGEQYVIRIAGANARMRVLRYERASRTWTEL
jgi:hypothetical protein